MSAFTLRRAAVRDAEAIGALIAHGSARDPVLWAERAKRFILGEDPPRAVFVAEVDGEVIGYTRVAWLPCVEPTDPRCAPEGWYLLGLNVAPDHRRKGIGTALVACRIAWLRERGATGWLRYFRDWDNEASRAVHAGFGFALESEDVWAPGLEDPEKRLVLERMAL